MTIAVGVITEKYIVIAADSQESSGDMKLRTEKIAMRSGESRRVAITGAGDVGYLAYIKQEIGRLFLDGAPSLDEFEQSLRSLMVEFYGTHCLPFAATSFGDALSVELIIGAIVNGETRMWVTNLSTVRRGSLIAAVGAGASWAMPIMRRFGYSPLNFQSSTLVALDAVFLAKERVEGCGKDTMLWMLTTDQQGMRIGDRDNIKLVEEIFREYTEQLVRAERSQPTIRRRDPTARYA